MQQTADEKDQRIDQLEWDIEKLVEIKNPQGANKEMLLKLRAPTQPNEIEWRVQSTGESKDGIWARIIPYIDARAVIDRLDHAVGPQRWSDEYKPVTNGFICKLSIFTLNGWISKEDASDFSDIEPIKGGVSGALKRAAVKWGIGRDLYTYEPEYADVSMERQPGWNWAKTKEGKQFYWRVKP